MSSRVPTESQIYTCESHRGTLRRRNRVEPVIECRATTAFSRVPCFLDLCVTTQTCLSRASHHNRRRLAVAWLALPVAWGGIDDRDNVASSILMVTACCEEDDIAMEAHLPINKWNNQRHKQSRELNNRSRSFLHSLLHVFVIALVSLSLSSTCLAIVRPSIRLRIRHGMVSDS
jgi:hypothetical protein